MSNWDLLGGNEDDGGGAEGVEYVGVVEEDVHVQEPTRQPRQTVRRVPQTNQVMYPVQQRRKNPNGVVGASNRDAEDLVSYVNMPFGKQLGLTPTAVELIHTTPMSDLNGQMAQRIEPGTYVMYGPSRAAGMGTDPLYDEIIGTQAQAQAQAQAPAVAPNGLGTDTSWISGLISGVAELGAGIATAVSQRRISQDDARTERLRIAAEQEASASARDIAFQETRLEHAERLAEIAAGADELAALRAQNEEAAALRAQAPPPSIGTGAGGGGGSPVGWIVGGVIGLGVVGGIIYFVMRKKGDKEGEE